MRPKMMMALIAHQSGVARRRQEGFALLLSLFVGLAVVIGWLMLAARSSSSRLGAALQSENREARLVAESAVDLVINELNQPRNRMLLAFGEDLEEDWQNAAPLRNPCGVPDEKGNLQLNPPPSAIIAQLGKQEYIDLPAVAVNDRLSRRFRLIDVTLKNSNRESGSAYSPWRINLREPGAVGYIELEVEGQVLRNGVPAATARITREYKVVPKCCNRSFRGPGEDAINPSTGMKPGEYGNDDRSCLNLPGLLVGTGNNAKFNDGRIRRFSTTNPSIFSREPDPFGAVNNPDEILCYSESKCLINTISTVSGKIPVNSINENAPKVPVLGVDGLPCSDSDSKCIEDGINKARAGEFKARSIDVIKRGDKDYIRVNSENKVEICNKETAPDNDKTAASQKEIDTYGKIAPKNSNQTDSEPDCELMVDDKNNYVCAMDDDNNGFKSHHCRIKNIFVNDDPGDPIQPNAVNNNTLFIDSSNGPIYLYVNEDWAITDPNKASTEVKERLGNMSKPEPYRSIYTVGESHDGQIKHVYCKTPLTGSAACTEDAPLRLTSRAAIVSACKRRFDEKNQRAVEDCQDKDPNTNNKNSVNTIIGNDGFVHDLFLFMPNSSITIKGSSNLLEKPHVRGALWTNFLEFDVRGVLEVPNITFYGLETSFEEKFIPKNRFDYIARSITSSFLFRR